MRSGSLVAPSWVLSAAHCFSEQDSGDPADWTIATYIGRLTVVGLPPGAETRIVRRLVVQDGYAKELQENDIALLELAAPLPEPVIALQLQADRAQETDRPVTVTGWGMTRWVVRKADNEGHVGFVDVGQRIANVVTTRKPGYLTVFDATPDGGLKQIYPNAASPRSPVSSTIGSMRIRPGEPVLIPDYRNAYRGFDVEIIEPRGDGVMVAVLSDKPLASVGTPRLRRLSLRPRRGS